MRSANPSRSACTLIELLVVIAILAILASLLLPALTRSKEKGKAIYSLNNLKQLQLASLLYSGDNNEFVPGNYPGDEGGMFPQSPSWASGMLTYESDGYPGVAQNTNTSLLLEPINGRIGNYTRTAQLYKCPSDRSWALINGQRFGRVRSYSLSAFVGSDPWSPSVLYRKYGKTSEMSEPAPERTFTFIDENEDSISDSCFLIFPLPDSGWLRLPASHHGGAGPLAFADGHAELKRWLAPGTIQPVRHERSRGAPSNADLWWLQERTTSKIR